MTKSGRGRGQFTSQRALGTVGKLCASLAALGLAGVMLPRWLWYRRGHPPDGSRSGYLTDGDGPTLAYTHLKRGHNRLVVVAHGFMKSKDLPAIVRMCARLTERVDVLAFDFPGHGGSAGEAALDFPAAAGELERVVAYARTQGYASVGVLGYSMGAAAALIAAAAGAPLDALVAVSSPVAPHSFWVADVLGLRGFYAERPKAVWRGWARLMGTRLADRHHAGTWPIEVISRLPSMPVLFVHCGLDTLVHREQTEALYAQAAPPKAYLYVPYALHASPAAGADQLLEWLDRNLPTDGTDDVDMSDKMQEATACTTR